MEGLKKYQRAKRTKRELKAAIVATAGSARLLHYGGAGRPIIFVPSLINPHFVLDLSDSNSLMGYLRERGLNVYLVDWGFPSVEDRELGLADHVAQRLLPLLADLKEPPVLAGYCLGGTMTAAASAMMETSALVMIAAPWDFDGFPAPDRERIIALWDKAKPMCERLGYVPMEVLQAGFWTLDPGRTIRKYAAFADMPEGSDAANAFIVVEDWANEGAPLTFAAGRDLFERLYTANESGKGQWRVGDKIIDPASLQCPFLNIISDTDHIVPAASASRGGKELRLESGHVGMIVGGRAREQLWAPLAEWLLESTLR